MASGAQIGRTSATRVLSRVLFAEEWQQAWHPLAMKLTFASSCLYAAHGAIQHGSWLDADWLLASQGIALSVCVLASLHLEKRFRASVEQASLQGILPVAASANLDRLLEERIVGNSFRCFLPICAVLIAANIWVYFLYSKFGIYFEQPQLLLRNVARNYEIAFPIIALAVFGSIVASGRLGSAITMAGLAREFSGENARLSVKPDHPDGVNGVAVINRYYQEQALMLLAPCIWASAWLVALPRFSSDALWRNNDWRGTIISIWLLSLGFILLGYYRPAFHIRSAMRASKKRLIQEQGQFLSGQILEAERGISEAFKPGGNASGISEKQQNLRRLQQMLHNLIEIKEWPVSPIEHFKFLSKPAALFLVPVLQSIGLGQIAIFMK